MRDKTELLLIGSSTWISQV